MMQILPDSKLLTCDLVRCNAIQVQFQCQIPLVEVLQLHMGTSEKDSN